MSADKNDLSRDLFLFIGGRRYDEVKLLLDSGADVNRSDVNRSNEVGRTPLAWACIGGDIPMLRLLIERGAQIEASCEDGRTPLMVAACHGRAEAVRLLIEYGADVNAKTPGGATALMLARFSRSLHPEEVMAELLDAGAV